MNERRRELVQTLGLLSGAFALPIDGSSHASQPVISNKVVSMSAIELSTAIRTRQLSCREVMREYLTHIDRINPKVNAIVSLQAAESLLAEADARDRQLAKGEYLGWMHGFPQAPKDLALTAGIATTLGSPVLRTNVPDRDGIVVERARRSGAILIGKTNTPEFGLGSHTYNSVFGTTYNAYDQSKTAGGSSGGAAVALALHMMPVADGSDMMGSLRNPAAFNNVFGFRPSLGRVPYGPTSEVFYQQLGSEGPMARSVADLAMLLSVQAGYDERAPLSLPSPANEFSQSLQKGVTGARIGWLGDFDGYLPMAPDVMQVCESALKHFATVGMKVEAAKPDYPPQRLWNTWLTLRGFLVAGGSRAMYADPATRALMKPEAIWEVERGMTLTGADIYQASVERSAWYETVCRLFKVYDFLALPSAQVWPFDAKLDWPKSIAGRAMDTYHRWMEVTIAGSLAGLPIISMPAGFNADGLPMGLQLLGRPRGDLEVLQAAHAYEQVIPYLKRKPALLG